MVHTCNSQPSGGCGRKAVNQVLELSSMTTVPSHGPSILAWGAAENAHCGKTWQGSRFITGNTFRSAPPLKSGVPALSAVPLQTVLLLLPYSVYCCLVRASSLQSRTTVAPMQIAPQCQRLLSFRNMVWSLKGRLLPFLSLEVPCSRSLMLSFSQMHELCSLLCSA